MAPKQAKFGRKGEAAIAALMTQPTIERAARAAGVGKRTLYRWLREPEFQEAYQEARRTAVDQSLARLESASSHAVSALIKAMVDPAAPTSVKVRAADAILNHTMKPAETRGVRAKQGEGNADSPSGVRVEIVAALPCAPNAEFSANKSVDGRFYPRLESGAAPSSRLLPSPRRPTVDAGLAGEGGELRRPG